MDSSVTAVLDLNTGQVVADVYSAHLPPEELAHQSVKLLSLYGNPIWGIENNIEPEPAVTGNAYERTFPKRLGLPATLWDAAQNLKKSKAARDLFGDAFVDHFAATREWEEREFRKHISDWEMDRYFEII